MPAIFLRSESASKSNSSTSPPIELLMQKHSKPTVKQHLAAIRMLFDWLVTGQVMPTNPAHSVPRKRRHLPP